MEAIFILKVRALHEFKPNLGTKQAQALEMIPMALPIFELYH
jgi:hypothetical protein